MGTCASSVALRVHRVAVTASDSALASRRPVT